MTCSKQCANSYKKISFEEFKARANQYHNFKYKYDNEYINTSTSYEVTCTFHGSFIVIPKSHMIGSGCPACYVDIRTKTQEDWIRDAHKVFKGKYEYVGSYTSAHVPVAIRCTTHGIFYQTPANHLSGKECKQCATDTSGFNKTQWINRSLNSKHFESYKVYVIQCTSKDESFIKIGRTYTSLKYRFHSKIRFPYDWILLYTLTFNDPEECWNTEIHLHNKYKNYKYIPSLSFGGMNECFNLTSEQINELSRYVSKG